MLAITREGGYRFHEGIVHRVLGEALTPEDPIAASGHLETALGLPKATYGRNELAKTLVAQAELRRVVGDQTAARQLLERALSVFNQLGTLDWPLRVREALTALGAPATP